MLDEDTIMTNPKIVPAPLGNTLSGKIDIKEINKQNKMSNCVVRTMKEKFKVLWVYNEMWVLMVTSGT